MSKNCINMNFDLRKQDLSKPGRESWVPDDEVAHCKGCNSEFGMFKWRHHCRACGFIFCIDCSNQWIEIHRSHYAENEEKQRRVCTACYRSKFEARSYPSTPTAANTPTPLFSAGDSGTSPHAPTAVRDADHVSKQSQQKARISELKKRHVPLDDLLGESWTSLVATQPKLAEAIRTCQKMNAADEIFEMECEAVLQALRRGIRSIPQKQNLTPGEAPVCLDELLGKPSVWHFLDLMEVRRPFYKAQVQELKTKLSSSRSWANAKLT